MILPEEAVRKLILDDATASASLSGGVFLVQAEQNAEPPYAVLDVDAASYADDLSNGGKIHETIQLNITIWSTSHHECRTIGKELIDAIRGKGQNVTIGADTFRLQSVRPVNWQTVYEEPTDGGPRGIIGIRYTFQVTANL